MGAYCTYTFSCKKNKKQNKIFRYLEAVGKGSSELKNTADPRASENRRTEFIVLEK